MALKTFSWEFTSAPSVYDGADDERAEDGKRGPRSIMWSDQEMIHVDGQPRAYKIRDTDEFGNKLNIRRNITLNDCLVHMPGGFSVGVHHLRARGHRVTPPARFRKREFQ